MKSFLLGSLCILFSGCGLLGHRQYESQMSYDNFNGPILTPGKDFDTIAGDNERFYYQDPEVMEKRIPFSPQIQAENEYQKSLKREVYSLVNGLSDEEYMQYQKISGTFNNDSERIYYLNMPPQSRRHYLRLRGVDVAPQVASRDIAGSYHYPTVDTGYDEQGVVMLGMKKEQVQQMMGRPDRTEIAGNPRYQNERWVYGHGENERHIYFEGGTVDGWTQED